MATDTQVHRSGKSKGPGGEAGTSHGERGSSASGWTTSPQVGVPTRQAQEPGLGLLPIPGGGSEQRAARSLGRGSQGKNMTRRQGDGDPVKC